MSQSSIPSITLFFFLLFGFSKVTLAQVDSIDQLLRERLSTNPAHPVHHISIYLENKKSQRKYHKIFSQHPGDNITENSPFKIASSTKLMVATLILQLIEENKCKLTDPIIDYLGNDEDLRLDQFQIIEDKNHANQITIEQLLSHRSGLADIFNDGQDEFFEILMSQPHKSYTPQMIIDLYFTLQLHQKPKFKPGENWHYSDMNYVLLGLLIEKIEKHSLADVLRHRIFSPLKMKESFLEFYEEKTTRQPHMPQYVESINFSEINTSFDWAGGGIVSHHKALAVFITALFDGKLISEKMVKKMIDLDRLNNQEHFYGLGISQSSYQGLTFYGHHGFYGSYIGYCPEQQIVLSYAIGQAFAPFEVYPFINTVMKNFIQIP